jgi:hypothetical protein
MPRLAATPHSAIFVLLPTICCWAALNPPDNGLVAILNPIKRSNPCDALTLDGGASSRSMPPAASRTRPPSNARIKFDECFDLEAMRQFLREHVEKIIYHRDTVALLGSIPLIGHTNSAHSDKIAFRIDGQIARDTYRKRAQAKATAAAAVGRRKQEDNLQQQGMIFGLLSILDSTEFLR